MKKNMGNTDRMIRILLAAAFAVIYINNLVSGTAGIILLAAGAVFAVTSFIGFCPLYALFGIKTIPKKKVV
jgi:hypothetical protein